MAKEKEIQENKNAVIDLESDRKTWRNYDKALWENVLFI